MSRLYFVQRRQQDFAAPRLSPHPHVAMDSSPSTDIATRTKLYEQSAEFARLYYFFEKLTQPRSRGTIQDQESASIETTTADGPVPEDIAPLLKNLSAILTKDGPVDADAPVASEAQVSVPETPMTALASTFGTSSSPPSPLRASTDPISADHASLTRPRRNTVAVSGPSDLGRMQTRFPLREKRYPFTFKLLLHKLYDLEDWAAKVREVLAASQETFRSLSSSELAGTSASASPSGSSSSPARSCGSPRATFSGLVFGSTPPHIESPPPPPRRRRVLSASRTNAKDANTTTIAAATARSGTGMGTGTPKPSQPSRAVKKRIVNRRRSMSGLGVGRLGEWMYDVAVSSIDADNVDARGPGYESLRRRKRVFSSVGLEEERRYPGANVTNMRRAGKDNFSQMRAPDMRK
jgi:hypothetical protein